METKLTEEQLLEQLQNVREENKNKELEEKNQLMNEVYERCKDATYIRNDSDYPFYVTYRKISNLFQSKEDGKCPRADIHEEIRINFRMHDDVFGCKGIIIDTGADITTYETKARETGFVQYDYPITEEEYNKAKAFILEQIKAQKSFFSDFKTLPKR